MYKDVRRCTDVHTVHVHVHIHPNTATVTASSVATATLTPSPRPPPQAYFGEYGHTTATSLRLCENWFGSDRVVYGDSWFASVKLAEAFRYAPS